MSQVDEDEVGGHPSQLCQGVPVEAYSGGGVEAVNEG